MILTKAETLTVDALQTAEKSGDAIVVAALNNSNAVKADRLLEQLYVARTTSVYLETLKSFGLSSAQFATLDFNTVVISGSTEELRQEQIRTLAEAYVATAITGAGAQLSGNQDLLNAIGSNASLVVTIAEKYEFIFQGFLAQLLSNGGTLVSRGAPDFSKIGFSGFGSATGTALTDAIDLAAQKLVFDAIKSATFAGLDLYNVRLLANTTASTFKELVGDFVTTSTYRDYAVTKPVVDALIAGSDGVSAFGASIFNTLLKAQDQLKLSKFSSVDFKEGFASFLARLDLRYWQRDAVSLAPELLGPNLLLLDTAGTNTVNDLIINDFAATAELTTVASTESAGTSGNDFWQASSTGGTFTDAASGASSPSHDVLLGGAGADTINAGDGDDYVHAGAGDDTITGGAGDDILVGGLGSDSMSGGAGDDTYEVDTSSDTVTENTNEGIDTVYAAVNYELSANVERLKLAGSATSGTGNALDNMIIGNAENNTIIGNAGKDSLHGLAGDDNLDGGDGNDYLVGGAGADNLVGGLGNDSLYGVDDTDVLDGGAGDDLIVGGTGSDTLKGGAGNDFYEYNLGDGLDVIDDSGSDAANGDSIKFGIGITADKLAISISNKDVIVRFKGADDIVSTTDVLTLKNWLIAVNRVEYLIFSDGQRIDISKGFGSIGGKTVNGTAGNDTLAGEAGNDIINGNAGDDTITGGAGFDTTDGGAGNDTYVFNREDSSGGIETIINSAGNDTIQFGAGIEIDRLLSDGTQSMSLSFDGNDLRIDIRYEDPDTNSVSSDMIVIKDWKIDETKRVENLKFFEGKLIGIRELVYRVAPGDATLTLGGAAVARYTGTAAGELILTKHWGRRFASIYSRIRRRRSNLRKRGPRRD